MEQLKHECGVAMIRLLKPVSYYKEKYGKGWFWKGIKEDLKNLKEGVNWWKVIIIYVVFFAVAGLIVWLLP